MKRVVKPELLDSDAGTAEEVQASLADLRMVNRWFGGTRVLRRMLEQVAAAAETRRLSLLDVGAGSGDIPEAAQQALARQGMELEVTLLDRAAVHLKGEEARRISKGGHRRAVVGEALALPFAGGSFDVVGCSLLAHHLEPEELTRFVSEGLRVARVAVLINDLVRHPLHLGLAYGGWALYRSRLTRHDAPASVRRAYTPAEMRAMLARAGAQRVEIARYYLYRMGVIAWR